MAVSPSHTFGQIIGDLLEESLYEPLRDVASESGLYLDYKHPRTARAGKNKVAWRDHRGNIHDLDYVLELGGSDDVIGTPKAFIEVAWRRYTKHSRNKAQEIQGAIAPLAETYSSASPFLGAVLAGVFTDGSLSQLRSHGFQVIYYSYDTIVAAFADVGIDASFDEDTPDAILQQRVDTYRALTRPRKLQLVNALRRLCHDQLVDFLRSLRTAINRTVVLIRIVPLHGTAIELPSVQEAIAFIERHDEGRCTPSFLRYELLVVFSNGDEVRGDFQEKVAALSFLRLLI